MQPGRLTCFAALIGAVVIALSACERQRVSLEDRACAEGICARGFVCNPKNICVHPSELTGDEDAHPGDPLADDGSSSGDVGPTGDAAGDPSGDAAGDPSGDAAGDPSGDAAGDPSGDAAGDPSGDAAGDPSGDSAVPPGDSPPRSEWRVQLTFENAAGTQDLTAFPVLVRLNGSRINYGEAGAGSNICFVDSDPTTYLPFEIESWDAGGDSLVWVRVPRVDAGSATDHIWMHYGSDLTSCPMPSTSVWRADFVSVWHLDEDPTTGAADALSDSTRYGHHGTASAGMPAGSFEAGKLAGGVHFEAQSGQHILIPDHADFHLPVYSWSLWINPDDRADVGDYYGQPLWNGNMRFQLNWQHRNTSMRQSAAHRDGAVWPAAQISTILSTGTWYWIAATYNGTRIRIYLDGVEEASVLATAPEDVPGDLQLGGSPTPGDTFPGWLDEVRVSRVVRSAAWIKAEHSSMIDTLISWGVPERVN